MKHFITTICLQKFTETSGLSPVLYKNAENVDFLQNDRPFTHPILVPIMNMAQRGEKIRVTAILTNDPNGYCRHNYELFLNDLNTLRDEIGFDYGEIEEITVDYAESTAKHLACFERMIESVQSDDIITADVTYGNKPTSMALQLALTFAYLYGENTLIKALVYGEKDFGKNEGAIYDVSALFYLNSLLAQMTPSKPENPLEFIKAVLGSGGNDNG